MQLSELSPVRLVDGIGAEKSALNPDRMLGRGQLPREAGAGASYFRSCIFGLLFTQVQVPEHDSERD